MPNTIGNHSSGVSHVGLYGQPGQEGTNGATSPAKSKSPASPNKSGELSGLSNFKPGAEGATRTPPPPPPPRRSSLPSAKASDLSAKAKTPPPPPPPRRSSLSAVPTSKSPGQAAGQTLQAASHFLPPGPASTMMHMAGSMMPMMMGGGGGSGPPGGPGDDPVGQAMDANSLYAMQLGMGGQANAKMILASMEANQVQSRASGIASVMNDGLKKMTDAAKGQ